MFGIGMSEMIIILAVALLVFGPQKLPEIARGIAKGLRELRRAGDDLRSSVDLDGDPAYRVPARRAPRTEPALADPPAHIPGSELAAAPAPWPQPAAGTQAQGSLEAPPPPSSAPAPTSPEGAPEAPPSEAKGS